MFRNMKLQWKMMLLISATSLVILAVVIGASSGLAAEAVTRKIDTQVRAEAQSLSYKIDSFFARIAQIPVVVSRMDAVMLRNPDHIEQLLNQLHPVLEKDPDILSLYTAYESGVIDGKSYAIPGWTYDLARRNIVPVTANLPGTLEYDPSQPTYEYHTDESWYALAKREGKFVWGPPYFDEGGSNRYIVSAVNPTYLDGKFVGVAGTDVQLAYLNQIIKDVRLGDSGYAFVVANDKDQTFMAHSKLPELVTKSSTFSKWAEKLNNKDMLALGAVLKTGETGHMEFNDPTTGEAVWAVYAPIKSTGWSLVLIAPMNDLMIDVRQLTGSMMWIAILSMVVMASLAFGIARTISNPLKIIADTARRVTEGQLDIEVAVKSRDEVGILAGAFNQMVARLRETLHQEQEQRHYLETTVEKYTGFMAEVGQGQLTARLKVELTEKDGRDPLLVLGNQLNDTVSALQTMILKVREAANNLTTASSEILAATAQQASGSSEQSSAIHQTTTTVDEVRTISEQVVERAREVTHLSQRTMDVSGMGQKAVQDTIENMNLIKAKVDGISTNIRALSQKTQQIGEIISTVNDIASQSNILALNASIEAARAGEQGKGFSIVAEEVRNLAEQSKQATAQVRSILTEIQKATDTTVRATEEGSQGVESGVKLASRSQNSIEKLADAIQESAQAAVQVMAGGQQQATGIEQIALAMRNINQTTLQSLASTRQAEKAAQNLNALARELMTLVESYRA